MNGFVERYHSVGLTSRRRSGRRCESESWWRKGYTVTEREVISESAVRMGSDILRVVGERRDEVQIVDCDDLVCTLEYRPG